MNERCIVVASNLPDRAKAEELAAALVQRHAAACVNILSPCKSVYRWDGAVEEAEEVPVLIKTTASRYALVEKLIEEFHPYDTPEIISLDIVNGLPRYLEWVAMETKLEL